MRGRIGAFLLALLMVPVVIFANETTARAATSSVVSQGVELGGTGWQLRCLVQAYYSTSTHGLDVKGNVSCTDGPLTGYGFSMMGLDIDLSEYEVTFKGTRTSGGVNQSCQVEHFASANGVLKSFPLTAGVGGQPGCEIKEVCMTAYFLNDIPSFLDQEWGPHTGCKVMALGVPPTPATEGGSCTLADVGAMKLDGKVQGGAEPYHWFANNARVPIDPTPAGVGIKWYQYVILERETAESISATNWKKYVAVVGIAAVSSEFFGVAPLSPVTVAGPVDLMFDFQVAHRALDYTGPGGGIIHPTSGPEARVVGYGVYAVSLGAAGFPQIASSNTSAGRVGLNNAGLCSFYWGDAIGGSTNDPAGPVVDGSTGSDEPPVLEEPEPEVPGDEECSFSYTDPSTWLSGGMCAAVGLLGKVLDLLGGILKLLMALPTAFMGMFLELFVPDPDSWEFDGLMDQVKDKPPFSIGLDAAHEMTGGVRGYSAAVAGDCGNLLSSYSPAGTQTLSCSDVKNAPGMGSLYGVVTVALWSLTGLAIVRMIWGSVAK